MIFMNRLAEKIGSALSLHKIRNYAVIVVSIFLLYLFMDFAAMPLYTRQYQSIRVPDVAQQNVEDAEIVLKKAGLKAIRAEEKFDEFYPPNFVIFQNPAAGQPVKKGRRVYLTVSKGTHVFEMAKLVGLSERDARFILSQEGLHIGQIDYRADEFYPDGVVCAQSIEIGQEVAMGTTVDLTVSIGVEPTEFIVPNLIGKSLAEASLALLKAGLIPGRVDKQKTDELLPNTVISQSLEAGMNVSKGDPVNIVISELDE